MSTPMAIFTDGGGKADERSQGCAEDTVIRIEVRYGSGDEWEFDGHILRQRNGGSGAQEWEYDGNTLRPRNGAGPYGDDWVVQGDRIRTRSGSGTIWEVSGTKIRPIFGSGDVWDYDGHRLQNVLRYGKEWHTDEMVPLLVIMKAAGII